MPSVSMWSGEQNLNATAVSEPNRQALIFLQAVFTQDESDVAQN
jgi:hypothetical protein